MPFADQDMGTIVNVRFEQADAILLGRTTYDTMFPCWPQVTDPDNIAAVKLHEQPKYVVSSTLRDPRWHDTTVLSDKRRRGGDQAEGQAGRRAADSRQLGAGPGRCTGPA